MIGIIHETMVVHMTWVWTFFNNYIYIYIYIETTWAVSIVQLTHQRVQESGGGVEWGKSRDQGIFAPAADWVVS